jgi:hypothetical protein
MSQTEFDYPTNEKNIIIPGGFSSISVGFLVVSKV